MNKTRLEAFSDGVIAILITILVLELKVPHQADWAALRPLAPVFLTYVLSFVFLGIYWNNHHHLLHAADGISGGILWANMHLLFWLSLVPFVTGWMGENHFAAVPTAAYGLVLFCAGIAYYILVRAIIAQEGPHSRLAAAVGRDIKGTLSPFVYLVAVCATLLHPGLAQALYALVALTWLIPDRRIERVLKETAARKSDGSS
jgi:uncharacterized membrane protein